MVNKKSKHFLIVFIAVFMVSGFVMVATPPQALAQEETEKKSKLFGFFNRSSGDKNKIKPLHLNIPSQNTASTRVSAKPYVFGRKNNGNSGTQEPAYNSFAERMEAVKAQKSAMALKNFQIRQDIITQMRVRREALRLQNPEQQSRTTKSPPPQQSRAPAKRPKLVYPKADQKRNPNAPIQLFKGY